MYSREAPRLKSHGQLCVKHGGIRQINTRGSAQFQLDVAQ